MAEKSSFLFVLLFSLLFLIITVSVNAHGADLEEKNDWVSGSHLVKKEERKSIVSTEDGEILSVWIPSRPYHLQFITLEPNSLLLPVLLHADMIFYVHTGSGNLSWTDEDELKHADLRRGDVYRLHPGTVFFVQSSLESERSRLRINAIFVGSDDDFRGQTTGAYSSIRDLVLGFDKKVLQAAFQVSEEVIDEMLNGTKPPAIIHGDSRTKRTAWEMEARFIRGLIGSTGYNIFEMNKKKQKTTKLFNIFSEDKDFKNCNGWSTTVNRKKLSALKGTEISVFMVNLTSGSMMGPHWNPRAEEISVVLQGQGMIRVVCSSISSETECKNVRLKVEEGDVFAVPRFHPMAQMAFNNGTFVFMGFSTSAKENHPQFLAGKASVLRTLDKEVLAASFNIDNTTLDRLLGRRRESVILDCTSCAEAELRLMMEEMAKEKEAERKREEEEAWKKAEEKRKEEEEARKREEEEARKEEEERRKREEEEAAKKWEEEEAKRRAEEEARTRWEEAKRRAEEEERKRQEEEAKRREQEQEEARKREEEASRKEEEERRKREEEAEAAKRREEEEARQQEEARKREQEQARKEEEEARRREEEQEEAQKREEEAARWSRQQEEEAKRRAEEEARKRQEEQAAAQRREEEQEEARKREQEQQEAQRREEEAARWRRQQEEEAKRRAEEEAKKRQEEQAKEEEEARKRQEEQAKEEEEARKRQEEQEAARRREEEEARRREEEQQEAQKKEEEAARWRQQQEEEEAKRRAEEEARKRQEEQEGQQPGRSEEEQAAEQERKQQEEAQREEEAARQRGGSGSGSRQ